MGEVVIEDDRPYLHPAPETMGRGSAAPPSMCVCGHGIERHDPEVNNVMTCEACDCDQFVERR